MFAHTQALWEKVLTSLWFVPTIMTLLAAALAFLLLREPLSDEMAAWWLYRGGGRDASNLLATLLAALIPMAALLVSITMVVLTLAAGQLGPRIIRNFMSDTPTQVILGFFMATIIYLVLILRTLRADMPTEEVPRLAVSVGTLLVLGSVAALLVFVHRLARSIISDTMIERVGADLDEALDDLLPREPELLAPDEARPAGPAHEVVVRHAGYVQTVDFDHLVKRATGLDVVIELLLRPGHYLVPGSVHARIWGAAKAVERAERSVHTAVVVGGQRNAAQDLEFSVRQLVEIALRALSPGINDEFSALAAIDRLAGSLARAVGRHDIHRVLLDDGGRPRLLRPVTTFHGVCNAAFDQIRQSADRHPAVQMRLIERIGAVLSVARQPEERVVLRHHLDLMIASARRTVSEPCDLEAMERRYRAALGE